MAVDSRDPALARLVDRVLSARAAGGRLEIVGGGTKRWYGEAPAGEPLATRELAGISSYEPSELVVTARAGTPLAELEAALAERGQWLPFEPPRFADGGSVGGMVAAGLSGPGRATSGAVRDFVLGATLLNGRGELLTFGGQVMKNVAGYDVPRLLAGSMGVLGLVCEVSLKVLPRPPAVATLRFELAEADALRKLNEWAGQPLPLSASAWWDGTLVLRLAGAGAAVDAAYRRLGGEVVDPVLADAFWDGLRDQRDEFFAAARVAIERGAARDAERGAAGGAERGVAARQPAGGAAAEEPGRGGAASEPMRGGAASDSRRGGAASDSRRGGAASDSRRGGAALWRLSLPQTAPPLKLAGEQLVEWGGAQRWWCTPQPEAVVRAAASAAGGHATRWLGPGDGPVFTPLAPALQRIHGRLKDAFDPDRVFDPGRLCPVA